MKYFAIRDSFKQLANILYCWENKENYKPSVNRNNFCSVKNCPRYVA